MGKGNRAGFQVGDCVRYKPGIGTYGYEDLLEADGRVPGVVSWLTPTRVRVRLTTARGVLTRTVDAGSLERG